MNLEGDAFFEPDRVAMLADTYANNYQDSKYKCYQITELDDEHKDNKGKNGIWHNKGKVETEGVVVKGTYSTRQSHHGPEVGARKGVHAFGEGDVRECA